MIPLLDVNVLIPVHRGEHADHARMMTYVDGLRTGLLFFGIPEIALASVVRIVTYSKAYRPPYLAAMAIDQGFEFITNDVDFKAFPGLTWRHPLSERSITKLS